MSFRVSVKTQGDVAKPFAVYRPPESDRRNRRALLAVGKRYRRQVRERYLSGQMLRVRTGELKDSIKLYPQRLPKELSVGSYLPQAAVLEFGWPARNIRPRPYLKRALFDLENVVIPAIYGKALDRDLAAAGGKRR